MVIEFVGGPFDGHVQEVQARHDELAPCVALPFNENVMQMVAGGQRGSPIKCKTIAIYQLRCGDRYLFLGQRLARDFNLQDWTV